MTFEERIVEHMAEHSYKRECWNQGYAAGVFDDLKEDTKDYHRTEAKEWLAAYGSIIKKLIEEDFEVAKKAVHVDS